MIEIGSKAPLFGLPDKEGNLVNIGDFQGKWVVLYFYPRDNTPGCTQEACDFSINITDFEALNVPVIGISPDSPERHKKFSEKHKLKILLLSDGDHKVMEQYEVWQLKKLYGIESSGVIRTTFIINPAGEIAYIWKKVKVKGHIAEVKAKLDEFING